MGLSGAAPYGDLGKTDRPGEPIFRFVKGGIRRWCRIPGRVGRARLWLATRHVSGLAISDSNRGEPVHRRPWASDMDAVLFDERAALAS